MKLRMPRRATGFTLIEIIVVIAIMAVLAAVSAPLITSKLKAGDVAKCREQVSQIAALGLQYGQDLSHSHLLPASGMADDEETAGVDESEGWWLSIAPLMENCVMPQKKGGDMKVSAIFRCPSDTRHESGKKGIDAKGLMPGTTGNVSYVSWTDASEAPENPNSCIRTSAKQRLDALPWISDGVPVKGESVTDVASFRKMVRPAIERHANTIVVAYASGNVKGIEVDPEEADEKIFKDIAPEIAKNGTKAKGKKGKGKGKGKKSRPADDEDED